MKEVSKYSQSFACVYLSVNGSLPLCDSHVTSWHVANTDLVVVGYTLPLMLL